MIGEEYNEKAQKMKVKVREMIVAEYKYVDSRARYIDSLIERLRESGDNMVELLHVCD